MNRILAIGLFVVYFAISGLFAQEKIVSANNNLHKTFDYSVVISTESIVKNERLVGYYTEVKITFPSVSSILGRNSQLPSTFFFKGNSISLDYLTKQKLNACELRIEAERIAETVRKVYGQYHELQNIANVVAVEIDKDTGKILITPCKFQSWTQAPKRPSIIF